MKQTEQETFYGTLNKVIEIVGKGLIFMFIFFIVVTLFNDQLPIWQDLTITIGIYLIGMYLIRLHNTR